MTKAAITKDWIATAILESRASFDNDSRLRDLKKIVAEMLLSCSGPGVILFPGGHFSSGTRKPDTLYSWIEKELVSIINESKRDLVLCVGIDGSLLGDGLSPKDQIAIAVTRDGIVSKGRKFAPTKGEAALINKASNHLATEDGLSRIFEFSGKRYYLAVCYDTCGISNLNKPNPGCNAILNFVHRFEPKGEGPSGDVQYARKVFSGASKQWVVPVYASVVFFRRAIPDRWPSGVLWNQDAKMSVSDWRYEYNPMRPSKSFSVKIDEGSSNVRVFE